MNDIEQLEKLTSMLPRIGDIAHKGSNCNHDVYEYDVEKGIAIGVGLYKTSEVAVQRMIMSEGTSFFVHQHEVHEWAILYEGEITVYMEGGKETYKSGDMIYFPPFIPHKISAIKDSYGIFVTVPASKEYPDG